MPVADQVDAALDVGEADALFASLSDYSHLLVAVSGGPDSVALMRLMSGWAGRCSCAPELTVVTVDHGLRAASGEEAAQVGRWAGALGLAHQILRWAGPKPQTGLQAAAREARYRLMSQWCLENDAQGIVTAHSANDQAETVLMRLARGSGLDGLAGMASASATPWPLFRPLLGVTRQRLKATLQAAGQDWIDDPSNDDERFERIRMRKALSALAPLGVDAGRLAVSARRLGRASQALDLAAGTLKQSAFVGHRAGFGEIDLATYLDAPDELRIRLLQMLVWQFGSHDMPRLAALERLADWIVDGQGRARTIAGCRIARRKRTLLIGREPGRIAVEPMQLDADGSCAEGVWDRRFRFRVSGARAKDALSVVPFHALRAGNPRQTGDETAAMPAFVRAGLPALLNHGEMHSVPHLGITGPPSRVRLSVDVVFFDPNEVRPR